MANRGLAIVLASAIYAGNRGEKIQLDTEERIYDVINAYPNFRLDETKAELYAILADNLTVNTLFARAVDIIEVALNKISRELRIYHG